jgi:AraC family transcriptional regulator, positive regulator of tynA and feaB
MMDLDQDFFSKPELDDEGWRDVLRAHCGRYNLEGDESNAFVGWVRQRSLCGFEALDLSCSAPRIERTNRDVRLDDTDHYYAVIQLSGRSTMIQNEQVAKLGRGDVAFVDSTRPVTYFSENGPSRWLGLHLSRQMLMSHFGSVPQGGVWRRGDTRAGRTLGHLLVDALKEPESSFDPVDPYMHLVIYDLLGSLFMTSEPAPALAADKLFSRVCTVIRNHFTNPEIGPSQIAAEAGISLRYLQKLFTSRGSTCSHFLHSLRLEHAAHLLHRRGLLKTAQPLYEIAYACGFNDYSYFARCFRQRFGYPPARAEGLGEALERATCPKGAIDPRHQSS